MKLSIQAGKQSQSVNVFIQDSSSTTGAGLTGLAYNTSGLTAYYSHAGANAGANAITLATLAAVNSAYSSGGFKEINSTTMPGWYRFDIPDACLAASKGRSVAIHLQGATNMAPLPIEIELTGWDNQDAVRGGMTALPNAAADAAGGLPVSDAGGLDLDARLDAAVSSRAAAADYTTARAAKLDNLDVAVSTRLASASYTAPLDAAGVRSAVGLASANLDTQIASVKTDTGTTIPGVLGTPAGASLAADVAAVKTVADDVRAKTDNLPSDPADESLVIAATDALAGLLGTPAGASVSADIAAAKVDTEAIKAKTDNLPASPAAVSDIPTAIQNADTLLKRDMSAVTGEASRSPLNALRALRNLWQIVAGVLTVMKEDDTTTAWTANVTQTAGDPVSKIDPS
jgi:hypothetical protein